MESSTDTPSSKFLQDAALALYNAKEYSDALRVIKKAIKKGKGKELDAMVLAGLIYQESGEMEKAEEYFRKVLSIDPHHSSGSKSLGFLLASQNDKTEALDCLIKYIQDDHWDDRAVLEKISLLGSELDFPEKSKFILNDAWEHTFLPRIGLIYARYLRQSKDHKEAMRVLELVLKRDRYPDVLNEMAINLYADRQHERAVEYYQSAINTSEGYVHDEKFADYLEYLPDIGDRVTGYLVPDDVISSYWSNLADSYYGSERYEDALNAANKAVHKNIWNISGQRLIIRSQTELGRYDEAIESAQKVIDMDRNDTDIAPIYLLQAEVEEKRSNIESALEILRKGSQVYPEDIIFYFEESRLLEEKGLVVDALEILEEVYRIVQKIDFPENLKQLLFDLYVPSYINLLLQVDQNEVYWEKIESLLDKVSEKAWDHIYWGLYDELTIEEGSLAPAFKKIEEFYKRLPNNPIAIRLAFDIRYGCGQWTEAGEVLENALETGLSDYHRLVFLNNLGYVRLLLKDYEGAEAVLLKASRMGDCKSSPDLEIELGIAFFWEGKILRGDWGDRVIIDQYSPSNWTLESAQIAVKYNLATLALARGEADQANAYIMEILTTQGKEAGELGDLALLFLAYFRKDLKTAQFAWERLKTREYRNLTEEEFQTLYPEFYSWLNTPTA